jgi:hypothetical protein
LEKVSNLTRKVITENTSYASANDPYVVATELSATYRIFSSRQEISNLYLYPLATKAQTLGFTLFFMHELQSKPESIIFPFPKSYAKETSKGIGRIWLYPICLD